MLIRRDPNLSLHRAVLEGFDLSVRLPVCSTLHSKTRLALAKRSARPIGQIPLEGPGLTASPSYRADRSSFRQFDVQRLPCRIPPKQTWSKTQTSHSSHQSEEKPGFSRPLEGGRD